MDFDIDPKEPQRHDYWLKYTVLWMIPRWVKPNHVTVLRFILTPFVLWFLLTENYSIGVPLFFFTAFTDAVDGSMARLRKQITKWGSFYDPVADKLLIGSVVLLIVMQHINIWFALIIVLLELLIILGGYFRRRNGHEVSANFWGKMKMLLQVIGVMALLIALWLGVDLFIPLSLGSLSLAIVFAVISLFTYGI